MDATEARQISRAALKGPAIQQFVDPLSDEIRRVAEAGKTNMDPWPYLAHLRPSSLGPNTQEKGAIKAHFLALGFEWQDHPDPDPGHPASRPYTTISW